MSQFERNNFEKNKITNLLKDPRTTKYLENKRIESSEEFKGLGLYCSKEKLSKSQIRQQNLTSPFKIEIFFTKAVKFRINK